MIKKIFFEKRLEWLLIVLIVVIFDKIFIYSNLFYGNVIWPFNMILLGIVSGFLFHEKKGSIKHIKNMLWIVIVLIPFFVKIVFSNSIGIYLGLGAYMIFYSIIFIEVMQQITKKTEVTEGIIYGSIAGFLLLTVIASFSFILIDIYDPTSLKGIVGSAIPERYHQYIYFTGITLTTIGYGDILPNTDNARLLTVFWGMTGQFYMVAVVGIIIAKFTSKQH